MVRKKSYMVRRGKRGVWYLQERHCGVRLGDCLQTTDERIAEIRRREIHISVERGDYLNSKRLFADAVEQVRPALYKGKAAGTCTIYDDAFRNHILPWFGEAGVAAIETPDLVEYKRSRERVATAEMSIKKEIWLIRWVLKQFGRAVKAPDESYAHPHKPVDRFPTEDEVLAIIGQLKRVDYKAFCLVAAYSGLRQSDVLNLKWSDVDFTGGFIKVRQLKTGRAVKVPLNSKLLEAIALVPRGLGNLPVFPKVVRRSVRARWERAREKAGLEWVRFHDLRHFYLSYLASHGVDLGVLQVLAGHASIQSTRRYAKYSDEFLKETVEAFVRKPSAKPKEGSTKI